MGLGKTFQSITLIWTLLTQGLPASIEGSGAIAARAKTLAEEAALAKANKAHGKGGKGKKQSGGKRGTPMDQPDEGENKENRAGEEGGEDDDAILLSDSDDDRD
eukprot:COSAG05_NODE_11894_length_491_cov_1.114796_1_plen_103_part_10